MIDLQRLEVACDRVGILHGTDRMHLAAAVIARGHVDLDPMCQHPMSRRHAAFARIRIQELEKNIITNK